MSLLLYCVAPESAGECEVRGVEGAAVHSTAHAGLRFFFSEASGTPGNVAKAAREVLGVIKDLFSRGPVLPFRYPTLLEDEAQVAKLAGERGADFAEFLKRVGMRVQMDVRLVNEETKGPSTAAAKSGPPPLGMTNPQTNSEDASRGGANSGNVAPGADTSLNVGTQYLADRVRRKSLLEAASQRCRNLAEAGDFRVKERNGQLLCHALIDRNEVISFQERLRRLDLPGGVKAVVSGPWPPAGFWEDKSD